MIFRFWIPEKVTAFLLKTLLIFEKYAENSQSIDNAILFSYNSS